MSEAKRWLEWSRRTLRSSGPSVCGTLETCAWDHAQSGERQGNKHGHVKDLLYTCSFSKLIKVYLPAVSYRVFKGVLCGLLRLKMLSSPLWTVRDHPATREVCDAPQVRARLQRMSRCLGGGPTGMASPMTRVARAHVKESSLLSGVRRGVKCFSMWQGWWLLWNGLVLR